MDPYARRSTWDLIKKKKEGRVIVLTTHIMDEADHVSYRSMVTILIISWLFCRNYNIPLIPAMSIMDIAIIAENDNI